MKATLLRPAALLVVALSACPAHAQVVWCAPALCRPLGVAPNACGPGYYWTNCYGAVYGPAYCLQPPFPPVGGISPFMGAGGYGPGCYGQNGYGKQPYGNF